MTKDQEEIARLKGIILGLMGRVDANPCKYDEVEPDIGHCTVHFWDTDIHGHEGDCPFLEASRVLYPDETPKARFGPDPELAQLLAEYTEHRAAAAKAKEVAP